MTNLPAIGSEVEVIIDRSYVTRYLHDGYKHLAMDNRIVGKVIPLPSWMRGDSDFAMFNYATKRESYIPLSRVVSIGGIKISQPKISADKVITVVSSKTGEPYTVRFDGRLRKWSCTCAGFQFRRKCRHVERENDNMSNKVNG